MEDMIALRSEDEAADSSRVRRPCIVVKMVIEELIVAVKVRRFD